MATPSFQSPQFRHHPTLDFADSPMDSECSVLFGANTSPLSSSSTSTTPVSRRDTLVLSQGFAGRHNIGANKRTGYLQELSKTPSTMRGMTRSSAKSLNSSPLKLIESSTSRQNDSGRDKENVLSPSDKLFLGQRHSAKIRLASSPLASPKRPMRYSTTPKTDAGHHSTKYRAKEHSEEKDFSPTPAQMTRSCLEIHAVESDLEHQPRRYIPEGAIGYDSDELTDADAEGSMEMWSDEDEPVAAGDAALDTDIGDIELQLDRLDVGSASEADHTSLLSDHGPSAPGRVDSDEPTLSWIEANGSDLVQDHTSPSITTRSNPTTGSLYVIEVLSQSDAISTLAGPKGVELNELSPSSPSNAGSVAPDQTSDFIVSENEQIDPRLAVHTTPAKHISPRRSPRKAGLTPVASFAASSASTPRQKTTSTTPSASEVGPQAILAAPTARRQLTKLTSRTIPRVGSSVQKPSDARELGAMLAIRQKVLPSAAGADSASRKTTMSHTSPARRRIGVPGPSSKSSISTALAHDKPAPPALSLSELKKPVAPPSSMIINRTKIAKLPSRSNPVPRTIPPTTTRPASAASASSSSSSSLGKTTAQRPTSGSNPSAMLSVRAASGTAVGRGARPAESSAARPKSLLSTTTRPVSSTSISGPRSASSTGALISARLTASGSSLLPSSRPLSAPSGPLLARRKGPALGQTNSAPCVLTGAGASAKFVPIPGSPIAKSAEVLPTPAHVGGSILPRPQPSAPLVRSPEKRVAQRARDGPEERSALHNVIDGNNRPESAQMQPTILTSPVRSSPRRTIAPLNRTILTPLRNSPNKTLSTLPGVEKASVLTAPADKVDTLGLPSGLFSGPVNTEGRAAPTPLPRPTRASRPQVAVLENTAPPASPAKEPVQLLPRPTRRSRAAIIGVGDNHVEMSAQKSEEVSIALSTRPTIVYKPPPALTQDELSRLTQKNTKRNQLNFNKLDVQTVFIDADRPPSPTSKIRRSISNEGSLGRPTTKEGREARAAKRRSALRSSTDGSETALLASELRGIEADAEEGNAMPAMHYRAPGDEEDFFSPVRTLKTVKSKKKSSTASATAAAADAPRKCVKWDKALVYEGALAAKSCFNSDPILKRVPLDSFGNSTATSTGFARPMPVLIVKMVYKNGQ